MIEEFTSTAQRTLECMTVCIHEPGQQRDPVMRERTSRLIDRGYDTVGIDDDLKTSSKFTVDPDHLRPDAVQHGHHIPPAP